MKTLKGTWIHPNRFIKENEELIWIFPYGMTIDVIRSQLPMTCFILLKENNIVVNWVEY